jgi:hypothetical protein
MDQLIQLVHSLKLSVAAKRGHLFSPRDFFMIEPKIVRQYLVGKGLALGALLEKGSTDLKSAQYGKILFTIHALHMIFEPLSTDNMGSIDATFPPHPTPLAR